MAAREREENEHLMHRVHDEQDALNLQYELQEATILAGNTSLIMAAHEDSDSGYVYAQGEPEHDGRYVGRQELEEEERAMFLRQMEAAAAMQHERQGDEELIRALA